MGIAAARAPPFALVAAVVATLGIVAVAAVAADDAFAPRSERRVTAMFVAASQR